MTILTEHIMKMLASIAALALVGTAAQAQEQTPDNAKLFVARLIEQRALSFAFLTNRQEWSKTYLATHIRFEGCTSYFTNTGLRSAEESYSPALKWDWDKIYTVSQEKDGVVFKYDYPVKLIAPSEDLAARLAFALETIRASCDATGGTGF